MDSKVDDTVTQGIMDEKQSSPVPENMTELAPRHREYLLERHGTLELDPVPAMDDADPYNWPSWKVRRLSWLDKSPLTMIVESRQSHISRIPRHVRHIHRRCYYPRILGHFPRLGNQHHHDVVFDLVTNCHPWRSSSLLEAIVEPIRSSSDLPHLVDRKLSLQYWMRQEPGLCLNGRLSCIGGLFH